MFRDIDILIKGNEKDMDCLITCVLCNVSILTDKVVYKIYGRPHLRKPMMHGTKWTNNHTTTKLAKA